MFLAHFAAKYRRDVETISDDAARRLERHEWNGNIRELQNVVEKAVILSDGKTLKAADLSLATSRAATRDTPQRTLEEAEENTIRAAVERCKGNLSMVAKELGISRPTLYAKLKKYGI